MQQQVPWLAAERYEVGPVVGRGGYGMVCRGLDRKTGQQVALKMLSPEAGRDPDLVERMLREQQALVALSGTCAVTAIDLCRLDSGAPCLVMEWLDGCDLEQQLTEWEAAKRKGSHAELLRTLKPLTETLERAHQIGIVHRDLKPANIFVVKSPAPSIKLLDFGLSRIKSAAPLTEVGMVMGSPSYIAPETWRGHSATLDGRADLYALGVIAFRWLTGALPFDELDLVGKMTAVTSARRPSAVALCPELPAAVDAWVSRALAIEAAERFQTGRDFYDALAAALRGELWSNGSADTSGVRPVANAKETPARKSALATAWGKAASLLKRFTNPRERAAAETPSSPTPTAPTPPVSTVVDDAPVSERKSIWLDSEELEDFVPEPESQPQSKRAPALAPQPKAKPKSKAKTRTRASPKAQPQAKTKTKAKSSGGAKSRAARKARSQKRKA
jgi:eukaryotic-like serine/threonine-protein kinase